MGSGGIEFDLAGDGKAVVNALDKVSRALDRTEQKLARVSDRGKQSGENAASGFDKATGSVRQLTSGIGRQLVALASVHTAYQLLISDLEEIERREKRAKQEQTTLADSIQAVRRNFKGDASLPNAQIEERIIAVSEETNVDPNTIAKAFSGAVSARGTKSGDVALQSVKQAARFTKDESEIPVLAGAFLDVLNETGGDDPRAVAGFLQQVQGRSRVESAERLASSIRGITGVAKLGDTVEESGELFGVVNSLLNDKDGGVTKTLTQKLALSLRQFEPNAAAVDEFGIPEQQLKAFRAARTTFERRDVLRENDELRGSFLAKFGDGEGRAAVESFVGNDPKAVALIDEIRKGIDAPGFRQVAEFEREVDRIGGGKFEPVAELERGKDNNLQIAALRGDRKALSGAVRELVNETVRDIDFGGVLVPDAIIGRGFTTPLGTKLNFGADPIPAGKTALRNLLGEIEASEAGSSFTGVENEADAKRLVEKQLATLERIEKLMQQQAKPEQPKQRQPAEAGI